MLQQQVKAGSSPVSQENQGDKPAAVPVDCEAPWRAGSASVAARKVRGGLRTRQIPVLVTLYSSLFFLVW